MDHITRTFGNWETSQDDGLRPREDGYCMDPFSSPISQESPDALHIHRELLGFYNNVGECMRIACILP